MKKLMFTLVPTVLATGLLAPPMLTLAISPSGNRKLQVVASVAVPYPDTPVTKGDFGEEVKRIRQGNDNRVGEGAREAHQRRGGKDGRDAARRVANPAWGDLFIEAPRTSPVVFLFFSGAAPEQLGSLAGIGWPCSCQSSRATEKQKKHDLR